MGLARHQIKKMFWGEDTALLEACPSGKVQIAPNTSPPRCLRRLDHRAFGTRPPRLKHPR